MLWKIKDVQKFTKLAEAGKSSWECATILNRPILDINNKAKELGLTFLPGTMSKYEKHFTGCGNITIDQLTETTCRWPSDGLFCGNTIFAGSYCEQHYRKSIARKLPK